MKARTTTGLLAVAGLGLLGLTVIQARGAQPSAPATIASAQPASRLVAAEGRVVTYPGAEVQVGAERAGRLVSVRVREGDAVRRGELLAEIESDEIKAALAEGRAQVAQAEADLRLAELVRARRDRLVTEKIVAAQDLDQAVRDVDSGRARLLTARATVVRIEAQLAKSRILAPISGSVVARKVDAGQTVEAGDAAFTLANLGRLRIEGEADEADAGQITVGAPVTITADGYPGRSWRGRVEEIPDSVTLRRLKPQDPSRPTDTRVLAVKVAFADPCPLKLGTTVELRITSRS